MSEGVRAAAARQVTIALGGSSRQKATFTGTAILTYLNEDGTLKKGFSIKKGSDNKLYIIDITSRDGSKIEVGRIELPSDAAGAAVAEVGDEAGSLGSSRALTEGDADGEPKPVTFVGAALYTAGQRVLTEGQVSTLKGATAYVAPEGATVRRGDPRIGGGSELTLDGLEVERPPIADVPVPVDAGQVTLTAKGVGGRIIIATYNGQEYVVGKELVEDTGDSLAMKEFYPTHQLSGRLGFMNTATRQFHAFPIRVKPTTVYSVETYAATGTVVLDSGGNRYLVNPAVLTDEYAYYEDTQGDSPVLKAVYLGTEEKPGYDSVQTYHPSSKAQLIGNKLTIDSVSYTIPEETLEEIASHIASGSYFISEENLIYSDGAETKTIVLTGMREESVIVRPELEPDAELDVPRDDELEAHLPPDPSVLEDGAEIPLLPAPALVVDGNVVVFNESDRYEIPNGSRISAQDLERGLAEDPDNVHFNPDTSELAVAGKKVTLIKVEDTPNVALRSGAWTYTAPNGAIYSLTTEQARKVRSDGWLVGMQGGQAVIYKADENPVALTLVYPARSEATAELTITGRKDNYLVNIGGAQYGVPNQYIKIGSDPVRLIENHEVRQIGDRIVIINTQTQREVAALSKARAIDPSIPADRLPNRGVKKVGQFHVYRSATTRLNYVIPNDSAATWLEDPTSDSSSIKAGITVANPIGKPPVISGSAPLQRIITHVRSVKPEGSDSLVLKVTENGHEYQFVLMPGEAGALKADSEYVIIMENDGYVLYEAETGTRVGLTQTTTRRDWTEALGDYFGGTVQEMEVDGEIQVFYVSKTQEKVRIDDGITREEFTSLVADFNSGIQMSEQGFLFFLHGEDVRYRMSADGHIEQDEKDEIISLKDMRSAMTEIMYYIETMAPVYGLKAADGEEITDQMVRDQVDLTDVIARTLTAGRFRVLEEVGDRGVSRSMGAQSATVALSQLNLDKVQDTVKPFYLAMLKLVVPDAFEADGTVNNDYVLTRAQLKQFYFLMASYISSEGNRAEIIPKWQTELLEALDKLPQGSIGKANDLFTIIYGQHNAKALGLIDTHEEVARYSAPSKPGEEAAGAEGADGVDERADAATTADTSISGRCDKIDEQVNQAATKTPLEELRALVQSYQSLMQLNQETLQKIATLSRAMSGDIAGISQDDIDGMKKSIIADLARIKQSVLKIKTALEALRDKASALPTDDKMPILTSIDQVLNKGVQLPAREPGGEPTQLPSLTNMILGIDALSSEVNLLSEDSAKIGKLYSATEFNIVEIDNATQAYIQSLTLKIQEIEGKTEISDSDQRQLFSLRIKLMQQLIPMGRYDEIKPLLTKVMEYYAANKQETFEKQIQALLSQAYALNGYSAVVATQELLQITAAQGISTFPNPYKADEMVRESDVTEKISQLRSGYPPAYRSGFRAAALTFTSTIDAVGPMLHSDEKTPIPTTRKKEIALMMLRIYQQHSSNRNFISTLNRWASANKAQLVGSGICSAGDCKNLFSSEESTLTVLQKLLEL